MHISGRLRPSRGGSTVLRVAAAVAAMAAALLGTGAVGAPASAHTDLVATTPTDGARLDTPPRQVSLDFTDEMSPDLSTVTLTVGAGEPRELTVTGGDQPSRLVAVVPAVDDLGAASSNGPRSWTVGYRVVSADGHPVAGQLRFRVPGDSDDRAAGGAEGDRATDGGAGQTAGTDARTGDDDPGAGTPPTSEVAAEQTSSSAPLFVAAVAGCALLLLGGVAVVRLANRGGRGRWS